MKIVVRTPDRSMLKSTLAADADLSVTARHCAEVMLDVPEGEPLSVMIVRVREIGETYSVSAAIDELEQAGYMTAERVVDTVYANEWRYIFSDVV